MAAVHTLRLSELTVQAGTVSYSLATPSFRNHELALDKLIATLRVYAEQGWRYGEADFLQALLRLGPLPAERAGDIPELRVPPLDGSDDPQRTAGTVLRCWIEAGGFVPPPVDSPLVLPVPPECFPSIPRQLLEPEVWKGGHRGYADRWLGSRASAVVPFWPDLGAEWVRRRVTSAGLMESTAQGVDTGTAGEPGMGFYEWLLESLAVTETQSGANTLACTLELASSQRLSAQKLAGAARTKVQAGDIPLGRLVRVLALLAYEGHLDCVWPALTGLVGECRGARKLPAGTAELLATCSELWDAIPPEHRTAENVPADFTAAVGALAARSSTKSALEAQQLQSKMGS